MPRHLWELLASHRYPRISTAAYTRENANKGGQAKTRKLCNRDQPSSATQSPRQQTSSPPIGMSQKCQGTKSLRSSPLRGGKSRETGSQLTRPSVRRHIRASSALANRHTVSASSSVGVTTPRRFRRNLRPEGSARTRAEDAGQNAGWPDWAGSGAGSVSKTGRTTAASAGC
jgi:hypothetical protein